MSDKKETIYHALSAFQSKVGKIAKDGTNPAFRSKYATLPGILDAIAEPLRECGLAFTQIPSGLGKLTTKVVHLPSGESIEGEIEMHPVDQKPQTYGSVITYQRRYALVSMLGLNVDDDDDGNAASGVKPTATYAPKEKPVPDAISPEEIPF